MTRRTLIRIYNASSQKRPRTIGVRIGGGGLKGGRNSSIFCFLSTPTTLFKLRCGDGSETSPEVIFLKILIEIVDSYTIFKNVQSKFCFQFACMINVFYHQRLIDLMIHSVIRSVMDLLMVQSEIAELILILGPPKVDQFLQASTLFLLDFQPKIIP